MMRDPGQRAEHRIRSEDGQELFAIRHYYFPETGHYMVIDPLSIRITVNRHEEWTTQDILFEVLNDQRCVDAIGMTIDEYLGRPTHFARLVDIHFSRLRGNV